MKRKAWTVMLITFLAGIALAWVQNKVPPVIGTLMEVFKIDMTTAGWLSSIFSVMGIVTALPAAFLLNKLGPKKSGSYALVFAIAGSLLGALSSNVQILMVSRFIEGVGVGLIAVVAPALISMWFPPEKRGLPMGIWGAWQMVAQAVTFFLGAGLTKAFGWQGLWWFGIALCIISLVFYIAKVVSPPAEYNYADVEQSDVSIWEAFKSPSVWLMMGVAFFYCIGCFGWCTWTATYWSETFKWDIGRANTYVGYIYMFEIIVVIIEGYLLDKIKNRKMFGVICSAIYAVILFFSFRITSPTVAFIFMFLYPWFEGAICTVFWTITPQTVKKPELGAAALAALGMGMNLGMVFGPPLAGAVIQKYGWAGGTIPLVIAGILMTLCMAGVKLYDHKGAEAA